MAKAGMLVGGSAGLNVCACKVVAEKCVAEGVREGGVTIVTLLCDHGIKYLSKVFNEEWCQKNDKRLKEVREEVNPNVGGENTGGVTWRV